MTSEEQKAPKKPRKARAAKSQENSSLEEMRNGVEIGNWLPAGLMEKCKCYKNLELYMKFINSDELRLRRVSLDNNIKEVLQTLKKMDGDKFDGGVVLGRQKHPIEDNSVILRVFTADGRLVAASVHQSVIDQYKLEHPTEFGIEKKN